MFQVALTHIIRKGLSPLFGRRRRRLGHSVGKNETDVLCDTHTHTQYAKMFLLSGWFGGGR